MRRIELIALLALLFTVFAGRAQDKVYVYGKDGKVESFKQSDIDSITYSRLDLEGVTQEDIVTQLIHFADTVVRMNIEEIDSVSFNDPEVVFAKNVVLLEDNFWSYVNSIKESIMYVKPHIPESLLPVEGQVLVYNSAKGLYAGFIGKVEKIVKKPDGYEITFSDPSLTEIFEHLIVSGNPESSLKSTDTPYFQGEISGELKNSKTSASIGVNIYKTAPFLLTIENGKLKYLHVQLDCEVELKVQCGLKMEQVQKENLDLFPRPLKLPIPVAGLNTVLSCKFNFGMFLEAQGVIDINLLMTKSFRFRAGIAFHENTWTPYNHWSRNNEDDINVDGRLSIQGSLWYGTQFSLGLGSTWGKDNTGIRVKAGPKYTANFSIGAKDFIDPQSFYEANKDSKLQVSMGWGIESMLPENIEKALEKDGVEVGAHLSGDFMPTSVFLLPDFTQPQVVPNDNYSLHVSASSVASRTLFLPSTVGLALYKEKNLVAFGKGNEYSKVSKLSIADHFSGLEEETTYQVIPYYTFLGQKLLTDISTEFKTLKKEEEKENSFLVGKWVGRISYMVPVNGSYENAYEATTTTTMIFYEDGTCTLKHLFESHHPSDYGSDGYVILRGRYSFNEQTNEISFIDIDWIIEESTIKSDYGFTSNYKETIKKVSDVEFILEQTYPGNIIFRKIE